MLSEFVARNSDSLRVLVQDHGVVLKKFPDEVLIGLGRLSGEVMDQLASADPTSRKVMNSLLAFRRDAIGWTNLSETAFTSARALQYPYAEPREG